MHRRVGQVTGLALPALNRTGGHPRGVKALHKNVAALAVVGVALPSHRKAAIGQSQDGGGAVAGGPGHAGQALGAAHRRAIARVDL